MEVVNKKMTGEEYELDFFGLKRKLPISYLSPKLKIANFNILGDVEFTEKAGEVFEKKLREAHILPDYFVGAEVKVVPLIHNLALRFNHKYYVILRKSIKGYMHNPIVQYPWKGAPHHTKKLVLSSSDAEKLRGKKVVILNDVVSTGATMKMLKSMMKKIEADVVCECAIFKQGDRYIDPFMYIAELPILIQ
jgi:adenine phosphoribosyltransferase